MIDLWWLGLACVVAAFALLLLLAAGLIGVAGDDSEDLEDPL
jgi:hypothetical protein